MHLDFIQSLSIAGDAAKANDDRAGLANAHAWVIDGATDLGDPGLLGNRGGAAWIAGEADRAFAAAGEDTIEAICRSVFATVAARYEETRTRDPEGWELPSASFLAVRAAANVLDCAWLGDCAALLIRDGAVTRLGPEVDVRDKETDLAKSVAHHGLGKPRVAPVLAVLRTARARPERKVLGVDPSGADRIYYASQPCLAGDDLVLMSDGFAAIMDSYGLLDAETLAPLLGSEGLHGIAARLRAAEVEDAACLRWPRFKQGDDATALWVRVAA
jgi:serine/threonine protein phosphatase PrpC